MSEMEYWTGNVSILEIPDYVKGLKDQAVYVESLGYKIEEIIVEEEWVDSEEVHYSEGKWYRTNLKEVDPDTMKSKKLPDGSVDFSVGFYNGGTHMGEIIDELIEQYLTKGAVSSIQD